MASESNGRQSLVTAVFGINQVDASNLFNDVTLSLPIRTSNREKPPPLPEADSAVAGSRQVIVKLPRIEEFSSLTCTAGHTKPGSTSLSALTSVEYYVHA